MTVMKAKSKKLIRVAPKLRAPMLTRIQAKAADPSTLTLDLFGEVGIPDEQFGFTPKMVADKLRDDVKLIKVRLNSDGGAARDGFAIYNLLAQHPARVEIDVLAAAMSAASYILMAADKSRIVSNGTVMIHEAWGGAGGKAEDLERSAQELRRINEQMVKAYAARTGKTEEEIRELVSAETYFTAEEALELGLVDEIIEDPAEAKALTRLRESVLSNAPKPFLAAFAAAKETAMPKFDEMKKALAELDDELTEEQKEELAKMLGVSAQEEEEDDEEEARAKAEKEEEEARAKAEEEEKDAKSILSQVRALLGPSAKRGGVVKALAKVMAQSTELDTLKAEVDALKEQANAETIEAMFAKHGDQVSPAMAKSLREQYEAGDITIGGMRKLVANLPKIPGTQHRHLRAQAKGGGPVALKWQGKSYTELKPAARAQLANDDPELFKAMREDAGLN